MVTGPMPRNPKATRPNAKTGDASTVEFGIGNSTPRPCVETQNAIPIRITITTPIQYELKLPATRPEMMFSDGPPSRELVTTSRTCRECTEVKTFTTSGMIAPASVPQVMIVDSFHHSVPSPSPPISSYDTT